MKFLGSAPVRHSVGELQDSDILETHQQLETLQSGHNKTLVSLRVLWEHRRFVFRLSAYGLFLSVLLAFFIPVRYESTARLMPPENQSGSTLALAAAAAMSGTAGGGLGAMAGDLLGLKSTSDIFVGILSSRTAQDKLIEQFNLQKVYRDRRIEDARKDLTDRTDISVDRKSQIISITVTDRSPQRAAAMAQAYIDELNALVSQLSTSSARRERIFLEGRLQTVNHDLEDAEREFSQFASKNTAIDVKEQGKAMLEGAATLQGELIAVQSEYEGLRQIYTDNNVRVRALKARISELQNQLDKLGGKGESISDSSAQSSDSLYPSIRKLPLLGVTYADLYRKTKIQEAVLETLTKEYEIAKVQEVKEIPTVKVLDSPNVPDMRSFPPRLLIIILGTLLACCFGVLFVLGSANWNAVDPQDPGKQFAFEVWTDLRSHVSSLFKNGTRAAAAQDRAMDDINANGGHDQR